MLTLSLLLVAALADDTPTTIAGVPDKPAKVKKRLFPAPELDVTEVALGAGFGIIYNNLEPLNAQFKARGYPEYGPVQITPLSINGELWANRHIPGFDYITYSNAFGPGDQAGVTTHFRYSLTELSYGYALVHTKGFSLAPKVGVGLANTEVKVQPTGPIGFDDGLDNPRHAFTMTKSSFVLDLGVNITYLIAVGGHDKQGIQTGFRWALRVGGLVQLFDTAGGDGQWTMEGNHVTGATDVRLDGAYARIIFAPSLIHRAPHKGKK